MLYMRDRFIQKSGSAWAAAVFVASGRLVVVLLKRAAHAALTDRIRSARAACSIAAVCSVSIADAAARVCTGVVVAILRECGK